MKGVIQIFPNDNELVNEIKRILLKDNGHYIEFDDSDADLSIDS